MMEETFDEQQLEYYDVASEQTGSHDHDHE